MAKQKKVDVSGTLEHLIYSPKGGIEGALLRGRSGALQLVVDKDDTATAAKLAAMKVGATVQASAQAAPPSDKGPAAQPVYHLLKLSGAATKTGKAAAAPAFEGKVARLNYARHGEANGVVLDTGDFIHTRPGAMKELQLAVGSLVRAEGPAKPLLYGLGSVVEATLVNGVAIAPGKAKKVAKKAAKKVAKKAVKKAAKKAVKKVAKTAAKKVPASTAKAGKKAAPKAGAKALR